MKASTLYFAYGGTISGILRKDLHLVPPGRLPQAQTSQLCFYWLRLRESRRRRAMFMPHDLWIKKGDFRSETKLGFLMQPENINFDANFSIDQTNPCIPSKKSTCSTCMAELRLRPVASLATHHPASLDYTIQLTQIQQPTAAPILA